MVRRSLLRSLELVTTSRRNATAPRHRVREGHTVPICRRTSVLTLLVELGVGVNFLPIGKWRSHVIKMLVSLLRYIIKDDFVAITATVSDATGHRLTSQLEEDLFHEHFF